MTKTKWLKVLKGLGIAIAGAFLTYIETLVPTVDFGVYTPLVVAVNSGVVNGFRLFLTIESQDQI